MSKFIVVFRKGNWDELLIKTVEAEDNDEVHKIAIKHTNELNKNTPYYKHDQVYMYEGCVDVDKLEKL